MAVRVRIAIGVGSATIALAAPPLAGAQEAPRGPRPKSEVRIDYLGPRPHTVQAGLGLNIPVGVYLRVGVIGAGGASWHDGRTDASGRADVIGRFAFDPFREHRLGLSAGGGLSVRYDAGALERRERWRALVTLVIDLEAPQVRSVLPAIQVGLGGGFRAGVILRGAQVGRR